MGCDLLSFSYLCATKNNMITFAHAQDLVVICFHFLIFVLQRTTHSHRPAGWRRLWFAFIFLSLCYKEQLCDYFMILWDVVICFHFLIFVLQRTTHLNVYGIPFPLWFAFIFLSLCYKEQLYQNGRKRFLCCDLLSFSYLCATKNNEYPK